MWQGVPKALAERLAQSDPIKSVVLALDDEHEFFLEYDDGRFLMILPKAWHETINSHIEDDQEASNVEEVALAAAQLRAARQTAKETMVRMDAVFEAINAFPGGKQYRTEYRTRYENEDDDEDDDEGEEEDDI
ncbi:hypothetical protein FRB94_005196 [Tulasnella sp. JGI-2019a]|nr:hypothetical protein FRB94_005196 [Tulasnella sp. JGI-2019a]